MHFRSFKYLNSNSTTNYAFWKTAQSLLRTLKCAPCSVSIHQLGYKLVVFNPWHQKLATPSIRTVVLREIFSWSIRKGWNHRRCRLSMKFFVYWIGPIGVCMVRSISQLIVVKFMQEIWWSVLYSPMYLVYIEVGNCCSCIVRSDRLTVICPYIGQKPMYRIYYAARSGKHCLLACSKYRHQSVWRTACDNCFAEGVSAVIR